MYSAGKDFPLDNELKILEINSPKDNVSGPYCVVHKNMEERWAIVAMKWDGEPRLGIRWFWGGGGNPLSSGHATWLVIPPSLSKSVLEGLPIEQLHAGKIDGFLCGHIEGKAINE